MSETKVPWYLFGEECSQEDANKSLLQALQLVAAHIPEIIASGILTAAETDSIRASITKAGD